MSVIAFKLGRTKDEFIAELVDFARTAPNPALYPSHTTIKRIGVQVFRRDREGKFEPAAGSKRVYDNAKLARLLQDFLKAETQQTNVRFHPQLNLHSDLGSFMEAAELPAHQLRAYLTEESRTLLDAVSVSSIDKSYILPSTLNLDRKSLAAELKPYSGVHALYRMRGGQNDRKIVVEEAVEISFNVSAEIKYTDHRGEVFRGILIVARDKSVGTVVSTAAHLPNLRTAFFSILSPNHDGRHITLLSRHLEGGGSHAYRTILERKEEGFVPRGQLKQFDPKVIEYYSAIDNSRPMTNNADSSFAMLREVVDENLIRGQKMAQLYITKRRRGEKKYRNPTSISALMGTLEKSLRL